MGVPKFYRWISERYPCLSEVINENQIPVFDNLYLDMNGIIHNCSHPNDDDITFRISEDEICVNIFEYIENLYKMIKPKKVFFMAVDGVAPRAKMNQQRARRFMSAKTSEMQLRKAQNEGKVLPTEKRFDSNCITPGTFFMTRLHEKLALWVEKKIREDTNWQDRRIYLSGHNCPGEGEHKIMDFIRSERASDEYDPNTRHCMYGLDADLIMLGIVSHEPHFSLLREEVKFNRPRRFEAKKKPQRTDSEGKQFHLLHLSLLREYLSWEFSSVKDNIPFDFDMERIADDWILMGLLVGNDFLPHLPNVHIHDDALPLLYKTYKEVLPKIDGYINESGYLNLKRFEKFLIELSKNDKSSFMDKIEDMDFMESKKTANQTEEDLVAYEDSDAEDQDGEALEGEGPSHVETDVESEHKSVDVSGAAFVSSDEESGDENEQNDKELLEGGSSAEDNDLDMSNVDDEFNQAIALSNFMAMDDKEFENNIEACWTRTINNSFKRFKKSYYSEKLKYKNISKDEMRSQAEGYVRAIQWNLHYYYHGCVSWSWFYPHHYAPYISDVLNFTDMKIEFELSKPFQPFEQLLAVLPAASSDCLPRPLQELMTSDPACSPIHDFYPNTFEIDLNGKKNDWEAVVLIPFINETRLLEAMKSKENRLSNEEVSRNSHGPHLLFTSSNVKGRVHMKRTDVNMNEFRIDIQKIRWGLLPNVKMDVYFPGFPTMKHLAHTGETRLALVNIFGMTSKKESMVLSVSNKSAEKDMIEWGAELLEEEVCVDWPMLKLAKVESIWGDERIVRKTEEDEIIVKDMKEDEKKDWIAVSNQVIERLMSRYAIEVEEKEKVKGKLQRVPIVWVRRFQGMAYETVPNEAEGGAPYLKSVKQFSTRENAIPVLLPLVVKDLLLEESQQFGDLPIKQAYPLQSVVWVTDPKYSLYGIPSVVSDYQNDTTTSCMILLLGMTVDPQVEVMEELRKRYDSKSLRWCNGFDCAKQINVNMKVFTRLTGTVFLYNEPRKTVETGGQLSSESKLNIGLNLKFSRRNVCLADYTKRIEVNNARGMNKVWLYSNLTCRIVAQYKKEFPELFRFLESSNDNDDVHYCEEIWPNEKTRKEKFEQLKDFLSSVPSVDAEQLDCDIDYADRQIIGEIEAVLAESPRAQMSKMYVPPTALFRAELYDGKTMVDAEADFKVLDRVSCVNSGYPIKKTMNGTIVGVHGDKIDVLFDKEFVGGSNVRGSKKASAIRLPKAALFNVTFGRKRKNCPKVAVKSNPSSQGKNAQLGQMKENSKNPLEGTYVAWSPKPKKDDLKEVFDLSDVPSSSSSPSAPPKNSKQKIMFGKMKSNPNVLNSNDDSIKAMTEALKKQLNIASSEKSAEASVEPVAVKEPSKQISLAEMLGGSNASKKSKKTDEGETMKLLMEKIASSGKAVQEKAELEKGKNTKSNIAASSSSSQPRKTILQRQGSKPNQIQNTDTSARSDPDCTSPESINELSPPPKAFMPPGPPHARFMPHPGAHFTNALPPMIHTPNGPMIIADGKFLPPPPNLLPQFSIPPQNLNQEHNRVSPAYGSGSHLQQQHQQQYQQQRQFHQQPQHFEPKKPRNAPQLTDFKPSTISRGSNRGRGRGHGGSYRAPARVVRNTESSSVEKEASDSSEQVNQPTSSAQSGSGRKESSSSPPLSKNETEPKKAAGPSKKSKKKKGPSRLGINFGQ